MADIKNFGIKGIASDVQMGKSGGRLKYDAGNNRFDLTQSDGSTLEDIASVVLHQVRGRQLPLVHNTVVPVRILVPQLV